MSMKRQTLRLFSTTSRLLNQGESLGLKRDPLTGSSVNAGAENSSAKTVNTERGSSTNSWQKRNSTPAAKNRKTTSAISQSVQHMNAASKVQIDQDIHHSFIKKFGMGSTYDPFDFSLTKLRLDREAQNEMPKVDRFKKEKFDPLKLWKDPSELSDFISANGKILPGYKNGHKKKTQKRVAKAIRRARAAGLLSHVHQDVSKLPTEKYNM